MQRAARQTMWRKSGEAPPAYWGLCLTAEQDGSTVAMRKVGSAPAVSLETSFSGTDGTWTPFTIGSTTLALNKGESVYFRAGDGGTLGDGVNQSFASSATVYNQFVMTGRIAASGDISSILDRNRSIPYFAATGDYPARSSTFVSLFSGCSVLTSAPELPALKIVARSYQGMFSGCTALTRAPVLPAYSLANYSYLNMFDGCSALSYVDVCATSFALSDTALRSCRNWLSGVAATGTIRLFDIYGDNGTVPRGVSYCPAGWSVETKPLDYFAVTGGSIYAQTPTGTEYSTDGGATWSDLTTSSVSGSNALVLFAAKTPRSTISSLFKGASCTFRAAGGNIATLFDKSGTNVTMGSYALQNLFSGVATLKRFSCDLTRLGTLSTRCFSSMFNSCTSLTAAPDLPFTTIAEGCYAFMFSGCTQLTTAPDLPATTLPEPSTALNGCYRSMFQNCASLTVAPALPATTLTNSCYTAMFKGCTSLAAPPALPATTLAESCYSEMFAGCTSLSTPPTLSATTLAASCYSGMFSGCTSLAAPPTLPATALAGSCYLKMFSGCTSLSTPPTLSATTLADSCYSGMFQNCTSLATAPALPASAMASSCYASMFSGCTSLVAPPTLSAVTAAANCCRYMFDGCTALTEVPVLLPKALSDYCYYYMFRNCTSLLSLPADRIQAESLGASSCRCMFLGCTSLCDVTVFFSDWGASHYSTANWLQGVAASGTFRCPAALGTDSTISRGTSYCPTGWTVVNT